ncbi:hypothetical protein GY45DRAFT_675673 [Cubamyces sp. BRFM 1775]|nr:hypothetical protein GY45DRAFT_675673 [Cubamyces sp. BRFM 1775]
MTELDAASGISEREEDCCGVCLSIFCGCCCLSCMNISNPWCLFRSGRGRRQWKDEDEDESNMQRETPVNFEPGAQFSRRSTTPQGGQFRSLTIHENDAHGSHMQAVHHSTNASFCLPLLLDDIVASVLGVSSYSIPQKLDAAEAVLTY